MEFFQLGDLDQYIATTIPEHGIKEITADLLEGLSIMHNEGFTHRDLKPKVRRMCSLLHDEVDQPTNIS